MKIGRLELNITKRLPIGLEHIYFGNNERAIYGRFFHFTFYYEK